ncbi:MAG: 50S ribosomal protein L24 [Verrucomicrobiales bacterium]|nr:50S ribosomal protein L24 [Verrucomicrobiales bacterium]
MSKPNFHIKKGDQVQVVSGAHKGATGQVMQIIAAKNQALVEGVRMIVKATRKSQTNPNAGLVKREGPIHVSNLKVIAAKAEEKKPAKAKKK